MDNRVLEGLRILEVAMFAPDGAGMHLADLGADVIKVESPGLGDPARLLGKPYRGEGPATRRWNRGKRSLSLDLRRPEGAAVFRELVRQSDAVIEGMRPGSLERRGLGYEALRELQPRLVFLSLSGWGESGPYRDLAAHGLAFDAFAGLAPPRVVEGRVTRPLGHVWQGLEAAPLHAALALVSALLRARESGQGCRIEVSQADAAAGWNGWQIAYAAARSRHGEGPQDADARELLDALEASAEGAGQEGEADITAQDVRYQYYATRDGHVLLMATETKFWENFCRGAERMDLFERWPGRSPADHDYGNDALREELKALFTTRSRSDWIEFFLDHDVPGAPVYSEGETHLDPHFESRALWVDSTIHTAPILGSPVRIAGLRCEAKRAAPRAGEHSRELLEELLGYDEDQIERLRTSGALGELS